MITLATVLYVLAAMLPLIAVTRSAHTAVAERRRVEKDGTTDMISPSTVGELGAVLDATKRRIADSPRVAFMDVALVGGGVFVASAASIISLHVT